MRRHLLAALTVGWAMTPCVASEPGSSQSLSQFCKLVSADPAIGARLAMDGKSLPHASALPRNIQIRTTICLDPSKPDKLIETTADFEQVPFLGPLVNSTSNETIPGAGIVNTQSISFLGLFDLGTYALSGVTIKLHPLGGLLPIGPAMEKSISIKASTGLTRLEGNLDKALEPHLNDHWTLETAQVTKAGKTTISTDRHAEYSVTGSIPASKICSALTGDALLVDCEGKMGNGKTFSNRYAYFVDYGWYFLIEGHSEGGKYATKQTILSVKP